MESKYGEIAVVVPTIRPDSYKKFLNEWMDLFVKHKITVVSVFDGAIPYIQMGDHKYFIEDVMDEYSDIIYNKNDGVRNFGFAFIVRNLPEVKYIISFDDDVYPIFDTDPIQEHLDALQMRVPVAWLSTANKYMRGFPYGVREEAEVVMSHGVWRNVPDFDAPTQLVNGSSDKGIDYYKGPIPKGIFYPHCAMNFAFKRKALPYIYQAPMGYKVGLDRFADIWMGIECKKDFDELGWAVVSGYSTIWHSRASNVWDNLIKESKGLKLNEQYGQDDYFKLFHKQREKWKDYIRCKDKGQ